MVSFQTYVIFSLFLVTALSIILALKLKHRLQPMAGMAISMFIGMNVGMTVGILFGSNFQGSLFTSTLYSIFVGALIGALCGMVIGILSLLEGMMAGLMGGMMGAMLGEMIPIHEASKMINIFLILSLSSIFLFLILLKRDSKNTKITNIKWMLKPLLTFLLFISYIVIGSKATSDYLVSPKKSARHHENPSEVKSFTLKTDSFQYSPSDIKLNKNETVSLILENTDDIEHDLEIQNFSVKTQNGSAHANHSSSKDTFHLHAKPRSSNELTFTPLESGNFEFYCTIPGHKESGMIGTIIVN